jgi:Uncharacterized conserved protein (COG2071)
MNFEGTPRRRPRWHHASSELDDFAIVSYRVEPGLIARHLPSGVVPEVFRFDDGGHDALVSAVVFRDRDFHFRLCPQVSMSCGQINYRAYVRVQGERGAWFFGTALDHPLVMVPRILWRMPWHRAQIRIGAEAGRWHMAAADSSGTSHCELIVTDRAPGRLDGFTDASETLRTLTHPADGWYRRRDGAIGHYSIWHDVMAARHCSSTSARFTFLEALGLITSSCKPHSALTQATIHFDIHTPPQRLRPKPLPAAAKVRNRLVLFGAGSATRQNG